VRTLIDTCVLSEARRLRGDPRVRARLEALDDDDIYLSVITLGELVFGVARLPSGERKTTLDRWVREIQEQHVKRILPIDARTARIWGEINARARGAGQTIPAADGLIAATALRHDLAVMTRNTAHFQATGARVVDPWANEEEPS